MGRGGRRKGKKIKKTEGNKEMRKRERDGEGKSSGDRGE